MTDDTNPSGANAPSGRRLGRVPGTKLPPLHERKSKDWYKHVFVQWAKWRDYRWNHHWAKVARVLWSLNRPERIDATLLDDAASIIGLDAQTAVDGPEPRDPSFADDLERLVVLSGLGPFAMSYGVGATNHPPGGSPNEIEALRGALLAELEPTLRRMVRDQYLVPEPRKPRPRPRGKPKASEVVAGTEAPADNADAVGVATNEAASGSGKARR